jgi:hypothetical protein
MEQATRDESGPEARHQMTPHEMLAASARLGSHPYGQRQLRAPVFANVQYDESGFPIRRNRATLTARVRRLLRG